MMMWVELTGSKRVAGDKFSERMAGIVRALRGDLSYEQASLKLRSSLSGNAIRVLETGKIGREDTVRKVAEGFWERACDLYGEQIRDRFGGCSRELVSDWLAEIAGFGLRHHGAQENDAQEGSAEDDLLAVARLAVDEYVRRAERPLVSNRDRLGQWVLEMGELYPLAAAELQVALRHGLEQLHTASDAEFAVMLEEDRERIRRVHEAAARAAGTEERG